MPQEQPLPLSVSNLDSLEAWSITLAPPFGTLGLSSLLNLRDLPKQRILSLSSIWALRLAVRLHL